MKRRTLKSLFIDNGTYKLVALFVTLSLWIVVMGRKDSIMTIQVPLVFDTRHNDILLGELPQTAEVILQGPKLSLQRHAKALSELVVDLTDRVYGWNLVRLPIKKLQIPTGSIRVVSMSPSSVELKIERRITKSVPVKVALTPLQGAYVVKGIVPHVVNVEGASSEVSRLSELWTEEVKNIKAGPLTIEVTAKLKQIESPGILPIEDKEVKVLLELGGLKK